jgi:hypothetical protein
MRRRCMVDSQSLTAPDARELERLIAATDFAHLSQIRAPLEPRPDMFYYRICVEDGAEKYALHVSDAEMSEGLRRLLNWLKAKAGG